MLVAFEMFLSRFFATLTVIKEYFHPTGNLFPGYTKLKRINKLIILRLFLMSSVVFGRQDRPKSRLSILITAKWRFFFVFFPFTFMSLAGIILKIKQLFLPGHLQKGILPGVSWLFRAWLWCDNCFFLYGQDSLVFWTFFRGWGFSCCIWQIDRED